MDSTMTHLFMLCLISIVQAVPAPGRGALKGFCNTDEHCKRKECCVSFVLPGESRTDEPDSVTRFVDGECDRQQPRYAECLISNVTTSDDEGDIHYMHCPCRKKHTCVPTGQYVTVGQLGICRPWCKSTRYCDLDECCVESDDHRKGKKKQKKWGVCQPMGVQYAVCHQINGSGRPDGIVKGSCPCTIPFTCGNIISEITDPTLTATCGFFRG